MTRCWAVGAFGVATSARSVRATKEFCRDKEFSVATGFITFYVEIEKSLSRQTSQGLLSQQSLPCCNRACSAPCGDRAWGWDGEARAQQFSRHSAQRARPVHATGQCCLVARCIVLCNCLNYSALALFMNTVHEHFFLKKVYKFSTT